MNDWINVSRLYNWANRDQLLDWLNMYGTDKGHAKDEPVSNYVEEADLSVFIRNKGKEFEDRVLELIREKIDVAVVQGAQGNRDSAFEQTVRLMSEGSETVDPAVLDVEFPIDRGELITEASTSDAEPYLRYKDTPSGISPRALPGLRNHLYVSASDEHDEDGVLLSDVFTDPIRRKKMVDKRTRKMETVAQYLPAPELEGPADADVTLLGWGSTWGTIKEAAERLRQAGTSINHLQIKFLVPLHVDEISEILGKSQNLIIVENNQSGQFARHLRAETGIVADGHIRKYDGEPFEPGHIVAGVRDVLSGTKVVIAVSTEPGWRTDHPTGTSGDWSGRRILTDTGQLAGSAASS